MHRISYWHVKISFPPVWCRAEMYLNPKFEKTWACIWALLINSLATCSIDFSGPWASTIECRHLLDRVSCSCMSHWALLAPCTGWARCWAAQDEAMSSPSWTLENRMSIHGKEPLGGLRGPCKGAKETARLCFCLVYTYPGFSAQISHEPLEGEWRSDRGWGKRSS